MKPMSLTREFSFDKPLDFALILEQTSDGERIEREAEEAKKRREENDKRQERLI